ncbi:hypothetical protein CBP51_17970 [Cellvibrio mixtus]|uniref:PasA protein n=1 Tax=Cellvibrio mixtus TaxID=39650 RepID=A0A266Q5Z5_9GAMM|nr:DUF6586 family protein [Cellvibrio mixtus]OZY85036.1 hypothetical protein CBP51_17970 [Cellvibrio mixtus]
MSISNFSLVNQKLAFAKTLCVLAGEASLSSSISHSALRLRQDALLSSCAFQLSLAFHFYLREIADRSYLKNSGAISSLDELAQSLTQSDKYPSEIIELRELASQSGSWLEQLLRYTQAASQSPRKEKEQKSFPQDNLILAVDITASEEQSLSLTLEVVEFWAEAFRAMVLRQRDTSAEF